MNDPVSTVMTEFLSTSTAHDYLSVVDAIGLCLRAHKDQTRGNGVPYAIHPLRMLTLAKSLDINNTDLLCGILLHDVVEDTPVPLDEIKTRFGDRVASMVAEVTRQPCEDRAARRAAMIAKAANFSPDAIVIKCLDRVDNLADAYHSFSEKKLWHYTDEAIELYLAMRPKSETSTSAQTLMLLFGTIKSTINLCVTKRGLANFQTLKDKLLGVAPHAV